MTGALNIYKASGYKIRNRNRARYISHLTKASWQDPHRLPDSMILAFCVCHGWRCVPGIE